MKKLIWVAAILFSVRAWCPPGGGANPPAGLAQQCPSNVAESVICSGYERQWCIDYTNSIIFACNPTTHLWNSVGSAGGGGGGAPVGATYITKTANSTLTGEFALASLGTGILKSTTSTGNLSIAVASDFPTLNQSTSGNAATASAFDHDPAACAANGFVTDISSTGALGCVQPTFANISGQIDDTQIPSSIARDAEVSAGYQPLDADLTTISALDQGVGSCGNGKILKVSGGVWTCQDDSTTTSGTGITTINGLTADPQSFADTDDSNVTLTISSSSSTHTFQMGWQSDLPFSRFVQGTALSVVGNATNALADNAAIVAGADGNVLRRAGTAVGFGAIDLADVDAVGTSVLPVANLPTAIPDANISDTLTSSIFVGSGSTTNAVDLATAEAAGILAAARFPVLTGDVSNTSGTVAMTIQDNSVDGTDIALGSDATGDIMYYNGTDYVRLPASTNAFVLTLTGGVPVWASAPGGGTVGISGTPAATQLTGWQSATSVQGVSGTAFDSLGNLTATSFTTAPDATLGGCLTLNEGLDDNTASVNNYVQLCVPDSGGISSNVRYDTNASGQIPATMIQTGTTAGTSASLTLHDLINGTPTTNDYIKWNGTNWIPAVAAGGLATDSLWTTAGQIVYSTGSAAASALAPGTSGYILQSGGTGAPSWTPGLTTTITSEAQGDILYRNASGWVNLPAGTAGRVLSTGGSGANPSWVAASGTGTVTNIATTAPISGGPITTTGTLSLATNGITDALFRQSAALSVVGNSTNATANTADIAAGSDFQVLRRSGTAVGFGSVNLASSAAVTGTLAGTNGGTGNAFISFSGPASTVKTFTLPNATATILTDNAAVTVAQGGTGLATLTSGSVLVGAGTSNVSLVAPGTNGNILTSNGSAWVSSAAPAGSGTVTATGGALTSNAMVLGAGTTDTKVAAGLTTDGTSGLVLGVAGTSVGSVGFKNATSGTVTLSPVTGALGTVTLSLPAATDRLVGRDTIDTLTNKTLTSPTLTTPALGVATATSINGNTFTTGTYTLTGTAAKTLNFTNSLTLSGTDSTTMTFPSTSATIARTDAANSFTGTNTFGSATSLLLGTAGSAVGDIGFRNATSGTVTLAPPTGALGTVTVSLPAATDTLVGKATSDTLTNKILSDSTSTFGDNGDTSKKLAFELSGITTATTRTWTVPNVSDTMVGLAATQTLTTKTIDTTAASGNVLTHKEVSFLPIEWCIDGGTAPTAAATLTSTNKVRVRDFSGTADQDVQCPWMVPFDIVAGSNVTFRVITFVDVATAPANTEVVAFSLAGATTANSELLSSTLGTAVTSSLTADATYAQYDRLATTYSSAVTLTGIAAGETALLKLIRLATTTDTYAQLIGVVGIEIKYTRQLNND